VAGVALTVPFLVATVGAAEEHEPVVYVSSTSSGNVGGVSFADEDILSHDTSSDSWEMYFDGSDVGLRWNDVRAFHLQDDGTILLVLQHRQTLGGFTADDSDVIAFSPTSLGDDTAGTFSLYFDGSDVGLRSSAEEIDALAMTPDGNLLISTSGYHLVGRSGGGWLWGSDEDLIMFDAATLGSHTSGGFERYFDGSDVDTEDVWGTWVDPDTGDILVTTKSGYRVAGLSGDKEDIIAFAPTSLGSSTSGTFAPFWDGDDHGFSGEYIDGLFIDMTPERHGGPAFVASLTNDWVWGWGFTPESTVTVEIFDSSAVDKESLFFSDSVGTDGDGNFYLEPHVHEQDLVAGTYIVVTGSEKTLEMVDMSFDVFDTTADLIEGTAPAFALVGFGVGNDSNGIDGETTADVDGNWSVNLAAAPYSFDLTADMGGQAWISDDDGDQTVAEPRFPQFQASLTNDWVQGWGFTPDDSVTIEIFEAFEGPSLFFFDSVGTDGDGSFNLEPQEGVDLVPGTYIVVTGSEKTLVMVDISFDVFDTVGDVIAGTADPGMVVDFGVGNEGSGVGGQATADGSGDWSVSLNTEEFGFFDLTAEMGGQVWVSDDDGDQTVAEPIPPPAFAASSDGDQIWGWSFTPDASVVVEIFDFAGEGNSLLFSGPAGTDGDGNFNLEPHEHGLVGDGRYQLRCIRPCHGHACRHGAAVRAGRVRWW
jgi:hypothetical protein